MKHRIGRAVAGVVAVLVSDLAVNLISSAIVNHPFRDQLFSKSGMAILVALLVACAIVLVVLNTLSTTENPRAVPVSQADAANTTTMDRVRSKGSHFRLRPGTHIVDSTFERSTTIVDEKTN
jgi:hypothetical protein